jgi:hypothetical protein
MTYSTIGSAYPPTATISRFATVRPEELRGRSAGVMVGAVFGLVWDASTRSALTSAGWVASLVVGVVMFAMLMTGALRLRRSARELPASQPGAAGRPRWRWRFTMVVAAEWVAIIAAVNILASSGHSQWIPAVICAAVGVHFAPLARLFNVRLYYATALALCAVASATVILGALGAPPTLWTALPGLGAAVTLWATSTILLIVSTAFTRRTDPPVTG